MNMPLENNRVSSSRSQIKIRFHAHPPHVYPDIDLALEQLARLPGCIDYSLRRWERDTFHWWICGAWISEDARARHYRSEQLQVLFRCLIRRNACMICCGEGELDGLGQSMRRLSPQTGKAESV